MRIMILGTHPGVQGPLPKIIPPLAEALRRKGHIVGQCGWGRRREHESLWEKIVFRLLDIMRILFISWRERPDILYINSALDRRSMLRDIFLLLASRGFARRSVILFHGCQLDPLANDGHAIFKASARLLFSLCDGVILLSKTEQRELSRFAPRTRFYVTDNVYQPELCAPGSEAPPSWSLPKNLPIVFFIGRLMPSKGVLDLLSAVPLVLKETPCHFLLAGNGPLEQEVRDHLSRSPWKEHVTWLGYLKGEDLELAYRLASILVLPTYHDEGFPTVIQEALGHGLPIVTTPIRGALDHLVDGVHVRFVPPKNHVLVAQALTELLKDPHLLKRMSVANLEKAKEFRPEILVEQYEQIFQQTIGS